MLIGLVVLAFSEFVLRGPVRFAEATDFNDLISPYIQTKAWTKGLDPYSPTNLVALWPPEARQFSFLKSDLADGSLVMKRGIPTAYPPTTFVLLAPLTWLTWPQAHILWLAVTVLVFGATVVSLLLVAGFQRNQKVTYVFIALALALAPFHTGLAAGSIVVVAVGLCAAAVLAEQRRWCISAGLLIGAAVALKPQIGLPLLFFYVLRRRLRVFAIGVISICALASIGILRLAVTHVNWLASYAYDNRILFARGSLGDFTEGNPIRFGLVNLQVLIYAAGEGRNLANLCAVLIAGILGCMWLYLLLRHRLMDNLLGLSTLLVLSLLPIYHRFYDASLLIFPLAWCLSVLSGPLRRWASIVFVLLLVFLVPGGTILEELPYTRYLGPLQHSRWWTALVLPHEVWVLLLLSVFLLLAMTYDTDLDSASSQPERSL